MIIFNKSFLNEEVNLFQKKAVENKIAILLIDYETSLVELPKNLRTLNFYPCFNYIITDNIFSLNFLNGNNQLKKIAYSNITLEFTLRCIRTFLLKLRENYKNLKFYSENNQEDKNVTSKFIDTLTNEYKKLELDQNYSMVNFLNNFYSEFRDVLNTSTSKSQDIIEKKLKLKFSNYDEMIYLSRLKKLFETEFYFKPTSVRKKIKEELNYNDIIYLLNLFVEGLVTLINSSLYNHLLLYHNSGIKIKSLVRKNEI
jgi:hypothetical protein